MKAKHTPGPWFAGLERHCPDLVHTKDPVGGGSGKLVGVGRAQPDGDFDEACANACLIAAAPILLKACEITLENLGSGSLETRNEVRDLLQTVIAKAKGE